jgi:(1->4)-alpha-D-glucan 1-alpha-D-glucosylmutase
MDQVSAVLHDPAGEHLLGRAWQSNSGRAAGFEAEEGTARAEVLERSFEAQLTGLVVVLHRLARADLATRDFSRAAIRRAVVAILTGMRVYRTYGSPGHSDESDIAHLEAAVARAQRTCLAADRPLVKILGHWLAGGMATNSEPRDLQAIAMRRFQQLSAPLAAKAVEDTAFYRYGAMLSRVDVGFDPGRFGDSVADFHQKSARRARRFPNSMLATATRDHKRGEDVRARLAVLSEVAAEWQAQLGRWMEQSASLPRGPGARPSGGDEEMSRSCFR